METVLLFMIFCHIVDDYYLQGVLAKLKQKEWWELNSPESKYKNDYKAALLAHAISWSFMIQLPLLISGFNVDLRIFLANVLIHAFVDDLKANKRKINLITDQLIHVAQIVATMLVVTKGVA